ncbi:hypothetical protein MEX01_49180 [Methylorubrum extorquens]|nr:hypothetical protein MEX01_49180 [Methylorubrum extorquens]
MLLLGLSVLACLGYFLGHALRAPIMEDAEADDTSHDAVMGDGASDQAGRQAENPTSDPQL